MSTYALAHKCKTDAECVINRIINRFDEVYGYLSSRIQVVITFCGALCGFLGYMNDIFDAGELSAIR